MVMSRAGSSDRNGSGRLARGAKCGQALNPDQPPFVHLVDGRRTIEQIIDGVAQRDDVRPHDGRRVHDFGPALLRSLWRLDFLAMALNTAPSA